MEEVHSFWFEQMNPRVANLETRMPSSCGAPCGEDFHAPSSLPIMQCEEHHPSNDKSFGICLSLKPYFSAALPPHTSTRANARRPSPDLHAKCCQQGNPHLKSFYMTRRPSKRCRKMLIFTTMQITHLNYNPGKNSVTIFWTIPNRLIYPSTKCK